MCGLPVEIDEVSAVRRRGIETRHARDLGVEGYRVPDDVHTGHCLRIFEFQRARQAIADSPVPDVSVTPPE